MDSLTDDYQPVVKLHGIYGVCYILNSIRFEDS